MDRSGFRRRGAGHTTSGVVTRTSRLPVRPLRRDLRHFGHRPCLGLPGDVPVPATRGLRRPPSFMTTSYRENDRGMDLSRVMGCLPGDTGSVIRFRRTGYMPYGNERRWLQEENDKADIFFRAGRKKAPEGHPRGLVIDGRRMGGGGLGQVIGSSRRLTDPLSAPCHLAMPADWPLPLRIDPSVWLEIIWWRAWLVWGEGGRSGSSGSADAMPGRGLMTPGCRGQGPEQRFSLDPAPGPRDRGSAPDGGETGGLNGSQAAEEAGDPPKGGGFHWSMSRRVGSRRGHGHRL